jgi:hypothetical protein
MNATAVEKVQTTLNPDEMAQAKDVPRAFWPRQLEVQRKKMLQTDGIALDSAVPLENGIPGYYLG